MKPLFQTRFGKNPESPGNCFSACVASIMECALSDLPDEAEIVKELKVEFGDNWVSWPDRFKLVKSWDRLWNRTQAWLIERGIFMLEVKGPLLTELPGEAWCIISGDSPRGIMHSVVGQTTSEGPRFKVVHDPHPEGGGVREETYIFFVAINPERIAPRNLTPQNTSAIMP